MFSFHLHLVDEALSRFIFDVDFSLGCCVVTKRIADGLVNEPIRLPPRPCHEGERHVRITQDVLANNPKENDPLTQLCVCVIIERPQRLEGHFFVTNEWCARLTCSTELQFHEKLKTFSFVLWRTFLF